MGQRLPQWYVRPPLAFKDFSLLRVNLMHCDDPLSDDPCSWSLAATMALAMTALGGALQIRWGMVGPESQSPVAWLALAVVLTGIALFAPSAPWIGLRCFRWVVASCLVVNYGQFVTHIPCPDPKFLSPENRQVFVTGSVIAAFLSLLVVFGEKVTRRSAAIILVVVFAYIANWTVTNSPQPTIDVYEVQYNSADAFAHGVDPYNITFADPYGQVGRYTYAPWMVKNGRLMFGYPYLPETLFEIMPFRFFQLDFRYAQLLAMVCSASLIILIRSDVRSYAAAALFWLPHRSSMCLTKDGPNRW